MREPPARVRAPDESDHLERVLEEEAVRSSDTHCRVEKVTALPGHNGRVAGGNLGWPLDDELSVGEQANREG